jgi:predicted TIM-barrel fold metal-dependent hydrolase
MPDYRPYIEAAYQEEFDAFCKEYELHGSRVFDPPALGQRIDPDEVEKWMETVVKPGRTDGNFDPHKRLIEMETQGAVGEVLFPDLGLPFELYPPMMASTLGYPDRTPEQLRVANKAYNRWLADFCQNYPGRFAGQMVVEFDDVDYAIAEIRWAKEAGLKGLVLPRFEESVAVFDLRFDPIWSTCVELEMPVNIHIGTSAITRKPMAQPNFPHPAIALPIVSDQLMTACRGFLGQMIWGGVMERHPQLKVIFTELTSGWFVGTLAGFDHTWGRSYLRRDVREVVKVPPSEYFRRQCYIGCSLLSRGEVMARHEIGVEQMMFGIDFPHHEGTFHVAGTPAYLQATFGAAGVPVGEARLMLGQTAAKVFDFDLAKLAPIAERVGPTFEEILTPPAEDLFDRGDVHKPVVASWGMP